MRIAITGGIAEGKSTVLNWIGEMGWSTYSSDLAARAMFGEPSVQARLAEITGFGPPIDPADLRNAILTSDAVRRAVNRAFHPLIGEKAAQQGATFHEVPLLFEACLQYRYDQVWVVHCGDAEQRRRLMARCGDEETVDRLLGLQVPTHLKLLFADREIRTNQADEHVRTKLEDALRETFFKAASDP
jgi:dephospho-CoA kinase